MDILSEPFRDVYLIVLNAKKNSISTEVIINPLVSFVWLGAWIMTLCGIFALIPKRLVSKNREVMKNA